MSEELEIERTFLVKYLPENLKQFKSKKLVDIYIPRKTGHAAIRIRQQGDKFLITKKTRAGSANELKEETIVITEEDFNIFKSMQKAGTIEKTRYYYPYKNHIVEIDIFDGRHKGLVLAEIEFNSMEELNSSTIPDFCLADVTENEFVAGGLLCNISYNSLEPKLKEFGYEKIDFN